MNSFSADNITQILAEYKPLTLPKTAVKAAVLIPIVMNGDKGAEVLLTKRTKDLSAHGGEVSFPGGVVDKTDKSLEDAALRETLEEVGISRDEIQVAGVLDDTISKAGFRVTPFVGLLNSPFDMNISNDEVAKVYRIPVTYFFDRKNSWTENWVRGGENISVYFFRYEDDIIWGLTAKIMHNLLRVIKVLDI